MLGKIFVCSKEVRKAKRVDQKDFPSQGRYGKGVRAWDLPKKITLVGAVSGKPNHMATIVLAKGAPKSARLDAAAVRKRASGRGDVIVEMKKDEIITGLSVAWMVDRYVKLAKTVEEGEKKEEKAKKAAVKKTPAAKAKAKPAKASAKAKKKKK